jgi:hypothetical protein
MLETALLLEVDLIVLSLMYAADKDVPSLFKRLADLEPESAIDALQHGLHLPGDAMPRRRIESLLRPADMSALLENESAELREQVISVLGSLQRRALGRQS